MTYGKRGGTSEFDDVITPLVITALITSSGHLITDDGRSGLPNKFRYYAGSEVAKVFGKGPFPDDSRLWWTGRGDRYVRLEGNIEGPNTLGKYCGNYLPSSPVIGSIRICGGNDNGQVEVSGTVSLPTEVYPFLNAFLNGKELASSKYLEMGVEQKFLTIDARDWAYRPDSKSWLISYVLIKDVDSAQIRTPNYNTFVVVRISEEGTACIVKTFLNSETRPFLENGDYSCLR